MNNKGQYFTKNEYLKINTYDLIKNKPDIILEPSVGEGDLVKYVASRKPHIKFDTYEIDESLISTDDVIYGDFLEMQIDKTYKTIIGNPPYVKTKTGNLYIDFIDKCYNLLKLSGELIFIVPSDFIKLTSSATLINKMLANGTFTDIIHPHKENLFKNASIDVIIFRYCKNKKLSNKIMVNNEKKYLTNTNGILTFADNKNEDKARISEYFNIYVGMVTGKESVFKNAQFGNIEILNKENQIDKYILIDKFPTKNNELNTYMTKHKDILMSRKIRKFNENNWFQWGAPRNYETISHHINKKCLYVHTITRKPSVCFAGKVQHFGGGLIIMIPKNENININHFRDSINSSSFKKNYTYSGRFKIGHKQLCNALLDIPPN